VDLGQPLAIRLFFENTDGIPPHLRHFTVVLNLINRPAASLIGIFTVTLDTGDFYGEIFLFPALIKSVQNCPMASEPLIGCTPGGIKMASLVYSAGNAFPFMLLYAADHSLFAASIAALILSWPHAVGAVNNTTKIAEEIACFIFMVLPPV
jgi:hypothetical protein